MAVVCSICTLYTILHWIFTVQPLVEFFHNEMCCCSNQIRNGSQFNSYSVHFNWLRIHNYHCPQPIQLPLFICIDFVAANSRHSTFCFYNFLKLYLGDAVELYVDGKTNGFYTKWIYLNFWLNAVHVNSISVRSLGINLKSQHVICTKFRVRLNKLIGSLIDMKEKLINWLII